MSKSVEKPKGPLGFKRSKTSPALNPPVNIYQEVPESDHTCDYYENQTYPPISNPTEEVKDSHEIIKSLPVSDSQQKARSSEGIRLYSRVSNPTEEVKNSHGIKLLNPRYESQQKARSSEGIRLYSRVSNPTEEVKNSHGIKLLNPRYESQQKARSSEGIRLYSQVSNPTEEVKNSHGIKLLNPRYESPKIAEPHYKPLLYSPILDSPNRAENPPGFLYSPISNSPHEVKNIPQIKLLEPILDSPNRAENPRGFLLYSLTSDSQEEDKSNYKNKLGPKCNSEKIVENHHESLSYSFISQPPKDEILSCILISQSTDYGQDFEINKAILDTNSIKSLFDVCTTDLKILGLYGDSELCYEVAKVFLDAEVVPKIEAEEVLVCLYSPKYSRAVIIYLTSPSTYDEKPLKSSSSSILFVRYLLDLCPTVVACPSLKTLSNWYISDQPGFENPYSSNKHVSGTINIITDQVQESELVKLKVKCSLDMKLDTCITADGSSIFYQYDISRPDADDLAERFDSLLHNSVSLNIRDLIDNPRSRDLFFQKLDEDVNVLFRDTQLHIEVGEVGKIEVISTIEGLTNRIKETKELAIEELKTKLSDLEFKAIVKKFFIAKSKFEDQLAELCIEIYNMRAYEENLSQELFLKYLRPFLKKADVDEKSILIYSILDECLGKVQHANSMLQVEELANKIKIIIKKHTIGLEEAFKTTCRLSRCIIEHSPDSKKITISSTGETFLLKPKFGQATLKQMIQMGNFCYALFASNGMTYIFKLIRTKGSRLEVEECSTIPDENCLIAWGSDLKRFILFQNTNKIAYYGSVGQSKNFDRGISIPVYSERETTVVSAIYLSKQNKLVYIDQKGLLYYCDITSHNLCIVPVKDETDESSPSYDEGSVNYLQPKTGSTFLEVQSTESEDILFIRTENAIELYDSNFMYLKHIEQGSGFKGFKTMFDEGLYYIVLFQKRLKCLTYEAAHESKKVGNKTKRNIKIPGNPIADVIPQTIKKFGDSENRYKQKTEINFNVTDKKYTEAVTNYVNSLDTIHSSIKFGGTLHSRRDIKKLKRKAKLVKPQDFKLAINTIVPLHIATLENGNLYPMQNGLNNIENIINSLDKSADFRVNLAEELQFGHYEDILSELKDIKVISIIGRQSSGKSYLMNRIFGTRFSVAAHRCTHGIWMSLASIEGQMFIVLDCEGLFSMERTFQEETKLCLILCAISDYIILNQDLTFNRTLVELFEKFAYAANRINGSNLFKGKLEIAVRDVGEGEDRDAIKQIDDFIKTIIERNQEDFLINLFGGNIYYSFFHNFENEQLFNDCIDKARKRYLREIEPRWHSGKEFSDTMKVSLVSIMTDNDSSIDKDLFKIKMKQVMHNFEQLVNGSTQNKPCTYIYIREVNIYYITREVSIDIYELEIDQASPTRPFDNLFLSEFPIDIKLQYHSLWYQALNEYMKGFFDERNNEVMKHFSDQVPNSEEVQDMRRNEINKAEKLLKDQATQYSLCLRSCSQCSQACVLLDMHISDCSCETDHKCKHACSYCKDESIKCSFNAGHEGDTHACSKESHVCGKQCHIERCIDKCKLKTRHRGECSCLNIHQCMEKCRMHDDCKQFCKIDILEPHGNNHSCLQARCPKQCYFGDGFCASTDHLHDLDSNIEKIIDQTTRKAKNIHLCGNRHKCEYRCERRGICDVTEKCDTRTWASNNNEFKYQHFEILEVRQQCNILINRDSIKHHGHHICKSRTHRCDKRCPDCGTFCKKAYGHPGLRSSISHRNKDKCIFISRDNHFMQEIDNTSKGTSPVHTFSAGEAAKPELCYESCISKGRGHTHPIECKGGMECAQKKYPGSATHSDEQFYPYKYKKYDLLRCSTYWHRFGWIPPVVSKKEKNKQEEFGLCNFFCTHPSHSNQKVKQFCVQKLFHSLSFEYSSHTFECIHRISDNYDLCFVLDCTGSMEYSFSQVVDSITDLIKRWSGQVSIRTSIVGYKDHSRFEPDFPNDDPVKFFPISKNLDDANPKGAIEFINTLIASEGGNNGGEAMIDGLNVASSLRFRPWSNIITFIIGDEPPHGGEFSRESIYQRGCPCGIDWKQVLNRMKNKRIELKFIKLNENLNKTLIQFNQLYEGKMEVMNLRSMMEIGPKVTLTVDKTIQRNMLFSNK